ncbi:MAG TPA: PUA domain-containing protein [Nitrososphaerales archaeon]|nr:PUA domain-containing protein [Nitrososphaerales archaeon]
MKRWTLSKHDSIELVEKIESSLGVKLGLARSSHASCEEPKEGIVFAHFGDLVFVQSGGQHIPFLGSPGALSLFPSAVVDEGAIRFLLNGADVMRPGVKSYDQWGGEGKTVVVREDKKNRAIVVCQATVKSEDMASLAKGTCLKNIHHVGDEYWNAYKNV